jgi:hypothetical protein
VRFADLIGVALKHQATIARAVGVDVREVERACRGAELVDDVLGAVAAAATVPPPPVLVASTRTKPPRRRRKAAAGAPKAPRSKRQRKPRKAPPGAAAEMRAVEGTPDPDAWRAAARRAMGR